MPSSPAKSEMDFKKMFREFRDKGTLEKMIEEIYREDQAESSHPGVMSDGSKRRMTDHPGGADNSEVASASKQEPVTPPGTSARLFEAYPPGITSMSQWARTVCELPKVKNRNLTYQSMVEEAASEGGAEMLSYLTWITSSRMKSAKVEDLRGFLEALDWKPAPARGHPSVAYAGTSMPRRLA